MPELPDLEVFKTTLSKLVLNKKILDVGVNAPKSIINSTPENLSKIAVGNKFINFDRRGKHIIFEFKNGYKLILHLMLTGKLRFVTNSDKHAFVDCIWFKFSDGELRIIDQRRWIKLEIVKDEKDSKLLKKLGKEADEISKEELKSILKSSRLGRIKPILMDQKKIAGIGNAYADEILWEAKIHPERSTSLLKDDEIDKLYNSIKKVLKWGIAMNSKEVKDSLHESEREWMNVYRKKGKECKRCGGTIIQTKVIGRDTFLCPRCQKIS